MVDRFKLEAEVIECLKSCYDPEIPVNVYDLGLIYDLVISTSGEINIKMTLTSPNCPAIKTLPDEIKTKIQNIESVKKVNLELVWEPPFSMEMLSDEAKLALGIL